MYIFSLNRPLGRFSHRVAMFVWLFVCLRGVCKNSKHPPLGVLDTSGLRVYRYYWPAMIQLFSFFFVLIILLFLLFLVFKAGLLLASLPWIMGELAGGGSVALGISDKWRATCDTAPQKPDCVPAWGVVSYMGLAGKLLYII